MVEGHIKKNVFYRKTKCGNVTVFVKKKEKKEKKKVLLVLLLLG